MTIFSYKALNESGQKLTGTIEADTVDTASTILSSQGLTPTSIKKSGEFFGIGTSLTLKEKTTRIKTSDLLLFTKQIRALLKIGMPIVRILQIVEQNTDNVKLKKIASQMGRDISGGARIHEAFRKFPKVFSELYCSMLEAGEMSDALLYIDGEGKPTGVFERLIKIIEHEHKVKNDIKAALYYPAFVSIMLIVSFFVLLTYVIPKYLMIFKSHHLELPWATQISDVLYRFLMQHGPLLIVLLSGLSFCAILYFKTENGKFVRDIGLLKIPIVGPVLAKANISRFANIFEILRSSGVDQIESMNILSATIGNKAITKDFDRVKNQLQEGKGISVPLQTSKYFTPMVTSMIAIGEESDSLNEMLREITLYYDDEVEMAVKRMTEAIAPILTIGLAVIIGFFALSIFLPMSDLSRILK